MVGSRILTNHEGTRHDIACARDMSRLTTSSGNPLVVCGANAAEGEGVLRGASCHSRRHLNGSNQGSNGEWTKLRTMPTRDREREREREGEGGREHLASFLAASVRPSGVGPSVRLGQRHRLEGVEGGRKESHRQFSPSVSVSARASLRLPVRPSVRASFGLAHGKGACGMPQGRRSRSVGRSVDARWLAPTLPSRRRRPSSRQRRTAASGSGERQPTDTRVRKFSRDSPHRSTSGGSSDFSF